MKNFLAILLLLINISSAHSQTYTGALTVNNSTGCDYKITMHGTSSTMGGGTPGCNDMIGAMFIVYGTGGTTTFTWTDPYDFENGGSYDPACSTSCTPVGWTTSMSSVCGTGCSMGLWLGYYPADWVWTWAIIDWVSCPCGVAGNIGYIPSCTGGGGGPITNNCGGTIYTAQWTSTCGTGPCDVVIDIY